MSEIQAEPQIVVIGGGTGTATLLGGLKEITPNVQAVVNMSDDGGSSGILRRERGVLPPGDVRQCLVALSDSPLAENFNHRLEQGPRRGHPIGNLVLASLELRFNNFDKAVAMASRVLGITGQVIPATLENHNLMMQDGDSVIAGEYEIGHRQFDDKTVKVWLEPKVPINPKAEKAIARADLLVISPGNLFGSILPAFSVEGMRESLEASKAPVAMVTNLVTTRGQTDNWHAIDYAKEIEKYVGEGQIDYALYNVQPLPTVTADSEQMVGYEPSKFKGSRLTPVAGDLLASQQCPRAENDCLAVRSTLRHDPKKVSQQLLSLLAK